MRSLFVKVLLTVFVTVFFMHDSMAQTYIGSSVCQFCHPETYDSFIKTGHPHKLTKIEGAAPSFPAGTSPGVPLPPADLTWSDVSYMIGGFGWKARFMDKEGYILTGEANRQYDLANTMLGTDAHWTGYKTGTREPYTCGECHTTGWTATGEAGPHQDGLPGIYGTWAEPGVTCEACHGPGSDHMSDPQGVKLSQVPQCKGCHIRGDASQIEVENGLIVFDTQYGDIQASPHNDQECTVCHDPHLDTIYKAGGYKGDSQTCKTCHKDVEIKNSEMADFDCEDCHMPYAAKSAVSININYDGGSVPMGDMRTHIFRIEGDAAYNMFTDDGKSLRLNDDGEASIGIKYVCLTCHTDETLQWAADHAARIHKLPDAVDSHAVAGTVPQAFALYQNYPNPFNPTTTISFDLVKAGMVQLKLFNTNGQEITTLLNERLTAGSHQVTIGSNDLPSGVYLYQISTGDFVASKKMIVMK
jgi:hypothetical protein